MLADGRTSAAAVVPLSSQQENQIAPAVHHDDDFFARSILTPEELTAAAREKVLRSVLALAFNNLATAQAIQRDYGLALDFIDRLSIGTQRWQGLKRTSVNVPSK